MSGIQTWANFLLLEIPLAFLVEGVQGIRPWSLLQPLNLASSCLESSSPSAGGTPGACSSEGLVVLGLEWAQAQTGVFRTTVVALGDLVWTRGPSSTQGKGSC